MKFLAALLLLATLVSCAGPDPGPPDEVAVVEPGVTCRVGRNGGPAVAERGIGGTGAPTKRQVADRGIGGTGIVGVVTGFASICVDGLEVRFDKSTPIEINGTGGTMSQLRVGQLVVIKASGPAATFESAVKARTITVRYEVSGPIEAVDSRSGSMMVAGQRVTMSPSTWMPGRFDIGTWVAVSGLRQSDGTIIASRLDLARAGKLVVRGRIVRDGDVTRIGSLVLREPSIATVKAGTFVSISGRYSNGAAEVTSIEADMLSEDPLVYFGISTDRLILQAFLRVDHGMVRLHNGQTFSAGPEVHGRGTGDRNAIVWLKRAADGSFTATELHYTNYRAQPKDAPPRGGGRGAGGMILPPDVPPGPPTDVPPAGVSDGEGDVLPSLSPGDVPTSNTVPSLPEPSVTEGLIADRGLTVTPRVVRVVKIAAAN